MLYRSVNVASKLKTFTGGHPKAGGHSTHGQPSEELRVEVHPVLPLKGSDELINETDDNLLSPPTARSGWLKVGLNQVSIPSVAQPIHAQYTVAELHGDAQINVEPGREFVLTRKYVAYCVKAQYGKIGEARLVQVSRPLWRQTHAFRDCAFLYR